MKYSDEILVDFYEDSKDVYQYLSLGIGLSDINHNLSILHYVDYDELDSIFETNQLYDTEEYKKLALEIGQNLSTSKNNIDEGRLKRKVMDHLAKKFNEEVYIPAFNIIDKAVSGPTREVKEFFDDFNIKYTETRDFGYGPLAMNHFRFDVDERLHDQTKAFFDGLKSRYSLILHQLEDIVYCFPGTNVVIFKILVDLEDSQLLMYSSEGKSKRKIKSTDQYLITMPNANYIRNRIDKLPYTFGLGITGVSKDGFDIDFEGLNQLMQENGIDAEVLRYSIEDAAYEFYENQFLDMLDEAFSLFKDAETQVKDILAEIAIDLKETESMDDSLQPGMLKDLNFKTRRTQKVEDGIYDIKRIKRSFEKSCMSGVDSARYYTNGIKIFDVGLNLDQMFKMTVRRYLRDEEISQNEESAQGKSFFQN